jgi:predicted nucleotidyltransferase/DNA-binding HxlR family transcriptional regulator
MRATTLKLRALGELRENAERSHGEHRERMATIRNTQRENGATLTGLITSKTRIRVLSVLFEKPDHNFYYREIVDRIGDRHRGTIAREITHLTKHGYIKRIVEGKRKLYRINTANPIYPELKSIWMKTVGVFARLKERLHLLEETIEFAFVYGSVAEDTERADSDVDLMIIGTVRGRDVAKALSGLDQELGREINYSVFPAAEVEERLKRGDHFWSRLAEGEKVLLIGDPDDWASGRWSLPRSSNSRMIAR